MAHFISLDNQVMFSWSGCEADTSIFNTTQAANLGAERFLHDQHDQPVVGDDGALRPRGGREREEFECS